ncbi:MAG: DoxX family membrane protein, partial [Pseudomonadota bacterium]
MRFFVAAHSAVFDRVEALAPAVLPTLARFIFAATLFWYYVNSGIQKFGDGIGGLFAPDAGAYVTIFPKTFEAVGYDVTQLGTFHYLVALSGTWAEVILPVMILVGLFTRIA